MSQSSMSVQSLRSLFAEWIGGETRKWALCAALRDTIALLADSPASLSSVRSAASESVNALSHLTHELRKFLQDEVLAALKHVVPKSSCVAAPYARGLRAEHVERCRSVTFGDGAVLQMKQLRVGVETV